MASLPSKLNRKLLERELNNALRTLPEPNDLLDFSSNDYLGLARDQELFERVDQSMKERSFPSNGATGSRLLSGNHGLYKDTELLIADLHEADAALIFNSGYDANLGFFSSVPQRGDVVFYDEFIHASIRDGIKLGNAKSYKFRHNNVSDLKKKCDVERGRNAYDSVFYVVTESIFSMDGDSPDLNSFQEFCQQHGYLLVVDEAHAVGVMGNDGCGLVHHLGIQDGVFARIITFGKALGSHGAAILGSAELITYLVNFARSLIFTTGLPPHALATIKTIYSDFPWAMGNRHKLLGNIRFFRQELERLNLSHVVIESHSAIHCCIIPGNAKVKTLAKELGRLGFDVKPILSPTVPQGKERIRICLHAHNSKEEITALLQQLQLLIE